MPATTETTHDVVVLGGGSGGYACALRAAELGMTVALVEKDKLGGTCLHRGCIPTKALLHAAEVADSAREAGTLRGAGHARRHRHAGGHGLQEGVVSRLYKGLQGLVKSRAVTYVEGEGRLEGDRHRRRRRPPPRGQARRAGHRLVRAHAARPRDRRPDRHQRRGAGPGLRAGPGRRARRRRHRRRVRLASALLRRRGHHRRGAAPARRRRGPGGRARRWSARSASARSPSAPACGSSRRPPTAERDGVARGRRRARRRPAAGRRRSRPGHRGLGYEEAGVTMDRGFVLTDERLPHQRRRACTRSATSCPACSWRIAASPRASSSPRTSPG